MIRPLVWCLTFVDRPHWEGPTCMGAACFWHLSSCMRYRSLSRRQGEETSLPEGRKGSVVRGVHLPTRLSLCQRAGRGHVG